MVIDITKYCGVDVDSTRNEHLLALEIAQNQNQDIVFDLFTESFDPYVNGIYKIIESCFRELDIKQPIKIIRSKNQFTMWSFILDYEPMTPTRLNYGQFLGRPTNERCLMHAKHLTWQHKDRGIATYHCDIKNINSQQCVFSKFLFEYPLLWDKITQLGLPYSDIEQEQIPDDHTNEKLIFDPQSHKRLLDAYKNISIEVIAECNVTGTYNFISEKTLRPLYYGMIPLTVAKQGFEEYCASLGFDMFDDIIDKSYDNLEGFERIESVYNTLEGILLNKDELWLDNLQPRIKANSQRVIEWFEKNSLWRKPQ